MRMRFYIFLSAILLILLAILFLQNREEGKSGEQVALWSKRWITLEFRGQNRKYKIRRISNFTNEAEIEYLEGEEFSGRTLPAGGRAINIIREWDRLQLAGSLDSGYQIRETGTLLLYSSGSQKPDRTVIFGEKTPSGKIPVLIREAGEKDGLYLIENHLFDRLDNPAKNLFESRPFSAQNENPVIEIRTGKVGHDADLRLFRKRKVSDPEKKNSYQWNREDTGEISDSLADGFLRSIETIRILPDAPTDRQVQVEAVPERRWFETVRQNGERNVLSLEETGKGDFLRVINGSWEGMFTRSRVFLKYREVASIKRN